MIVTELFKSICHDPPKRAVKRRELSAEQERLERDQREHEDLMLFVRLVNESRQ